MHPADIVAAVKKTGTSLAALARVNGLSDAALRYSLKHPARRPEEALTRHLGIPPNQIWPDRYDANGIRHVRRGASRNAHTSAQRRTRGQ